MEVAKQLAQFVSQGVHVPDPKSLNCADGHSEMQAEPASKCAGRQAVQIEALEQAAHGKAHSLHREPLAKKPAPHSLQLSSSNKYSPAAHAVHLFVSDWQLAQVEWHA